MLALAFSGARRVTSALVLRAEILNSIHGMATSIFPSSASAMTDPRIAPVFQRHWPAA
jgi:hypothetical protein